MVAKDEAHTCAAFQVQCRRVPTLVVQAWLSAAREAVVCTAKGLGGRDPSSPVCEGAQDMFSCTFIECRQLEGMLVQPGNILLPKPAGSNRCCLVCRRH